MECPCIVHLSVSMLHSLMSVCRCVCVCVCVHTACCCLLAALVVLIESSCPNARKHVLGFRIQPCYLKRQKHIHIPKCPMQHKRPKCPTLEAFGIQPYPAQPTDPDSKTHPKQQKHQTNQATLINRTYMKCMKHLEHSTLDMFRCRHGNVGV